MSRPRRVLAAVVIVPALTACALGATQSGAEVVEVRIDTAGFQPAAVTVVTGTEVRWHNTAPATHTVTPVGAAEAEGMAVLDWGSGELSQGASFSHRFDTAGSYLYSSARHPDEQVIGVVEVIEP